MSLSSVTHPLFFVLLLPAFILQGWVLSQVLPFHRVLASSTEGPARLTQLDGLRGLLELNVFFLHAAEYHAYLTLGTWVRPSSNLYVQLGVFPVTMFFFLSGYLFWQKLMKRPELSACRFLSSRLRRLGPVYFLACGWLFLLAALASRFHVNVSLLRLIFQGLAWVSLLGSGHEINGLHFSNIPLGPSWTLRYEWFFYLSLPLFVWFARRRSRLILLLAPLAVISHLLAQWHLKGLGAAAVETLRAYTQFVAYLYGAGMLLATVRVTGTLKQLAASKGATAVSFLSIAVTLFWIKPQYGPLESLMLFVPFACICFGNTWCGLLISRPIQFLGRISYSLYLLHLLVLSTGGMLLRKFVNTSHLGAAAYWSFAGFCGAVAIVIAAYSYQYLEHPFFHAGGIRHRALSPQNVRPKPVRKLIQVPIERPLSS